MTKLNLDRRLLDHPEHFDDEIRAFRSAFRKLSELRVT